MKHFLKSLINLALLVIVSCGGIDTRSNSPLELAPAIEKDDGQIVFIVKATRLKLIDNEYFPDSEVFRVKVFDKSGKLIWQSNKGQNFFMAIQDVLPLETGQTHEYRLSWDKTDNKGNLVPPGDYTAELILPSKPFEYKSNMEFTIE
jgi:hypothetical protein